MGKKKRKISLADDDTQSVMTLVSMRLPPLVIGLILGFVLSLVTSRFEEVLEKSIQVAFFIPFVVYMADAVGTQTLEIYERDLATGKAKFKNYFIKEIKLGGILGSVFGLLSSGAVLFWFHSVELAITVGLSMFAAIGSAPLVALIVTEVLELENQDPAVGAGPIATVIQDTISVMLYGAIASFVMLGSVI